MPLPLNIKLIIPVILQVNVFIFVSINEFTLSRFLNMASKDYIVFLLTKGSVSLLF